MSTNNLDLTQVPDADLDKLAQKIETFYRSDASVKNQLSWHWEKNHMYLDGKQWIVYDGDVSTGGQWKALKVSKQNEYIPRPVTNYIFDIYQTLKSYLIKNKPRCTVMPNTQGYKDKSAAKISNLILEANWERLKESYNYEYAAACVITYGTVFKKAYWDTSTLSMARVPRMVEQPVTDPQTGEQAGTQSVPVLDDSGNPVFDEIPLGDVSTEVVEPYRIALDPLATDLHKARWIMEYSIQPLDLVQELYSKEDEGYTGLAVDLKEEKDLSGSMRRFYQLKNSSGVKGSGFGTNALDGANGSDTMAPNSVVLKEYYERPSQGHPKGRLVVVANNKCLYVGDSPYVGTEAGDWHPYSECRWEVVPGRFWGKSPLDDSTEIQKHINSIDSALILTRKTMAVPQKLIPRGTVEPGKWTGRPGQEIDYRDNGTGAKPETIPAAGVDAQVFQEREQRLEDIKAVSGAIDILKGDRPPGVTAASALNLLYEVGTGKLFPVLDRWKQFVESDQKKQLQLIARKYTEPRPDFIRLLRAKNTELSDEAIDKFIGSDLYDNFNVVVEAGSNIPKLQAAKQAMLMEAAQAGTLNLDNASNRMEFNRQMGITGFDTEVSVDTKRAEWENDLLDNLINSPANRPVVLQVDEHMIHKQVHARRMKEPSFMALPLEVQQAYMEHYMEHEAQEQQMMQMQQMEAMASGAPGAPGPGGDAMSAPARPVGEGSTADLKNAVMGDALGGSVGT